jgi:hypothetical protein
MRTDYVDGFILDRGFQVFIESYPESRNLFDYDGLDLKPFNPGAYVHFENNFYIVSDPFRRPQDLFASLNSPIGSLIDKVKVSIIFFCTSTFAITCNSYTYYFTGWNKLYTDTIQAHRGYI